MNKSITKTWGYVWYNRKCNHKKKKPRIEIIWLLTILLCCLRQLHISIELFYDQASMLLKYYLFSLSHSDKKWQALRTLIHMENKIWSCGENSVGARNSSSSIFLLKLPHQPCVGFSITVPILFQSEHQKTLLLVLVLLLLLLLLLLLSLPKKYV